MAGGREPDGVEGPAETEPAGSDSSQTLRLLAEDFSIGNERVETGTVRVQVVTHQHEEDVEVPLERERVEVEHVAVNIPIDAIPPIREEDGVTILPVIEEVVTIQRQLVLREELHIRRIRSTELHRERVTLRRQEAVVTRTPADAPRQNRSGG